MYNSFIKYSKKNEFIPTVLFVVLNLLILYGQFCLAHQKPLLVVETIYQFSELYHLLLISMTLAIATLIMGLFSGFYFALVISLYTVFCSYQLTLNAESEVILTFFILQVLLVFFFYFSLRIRLKRAAFTPSFRHNDLYLKTNNLTQVLVRIPGDHVLEYSGYMTNWDAGSCFVALNKSGNQTAQIKLGDEISLSMELENNEFELSGKVVGIFLAGRGFGIDVNDTAEMATTNKFTWKEYYSILENRGIGV